MWQSCNENCVHEEGKNRLYRAVILPGLYWCGSYESVSFQLMKKIQVSEHRVPKRIFGPRRECLEAGEDCVIEEFHSLYPHEILGRSKQGG
jgi:hypothetical protein